MKTKNVKPITIFLILAAVCTLVGYHFSYPIKLNMVTLPEHIKDSYNRGYSVEHSPAIVIYDGVEIGNKAYYLLEIGEDLGSVTLERGLTGRYKITRLGYGGGNFRNGIIEDGEEKYLLFGGRDITAQISKISIEIEGIVYDLHTQKTKDHFLLCTEIDNRVEDKHVNLDDITLYNEMGDDITGNYDLSGGGL